MEYNYLSNDPRVETVKQILNLPKQKDIWIAKDLIPLGCSFLGGTPKSYKTYLSLSIAKSLTEAKPVFGKFEVKNKYRVMILDRENSNYLIRDRLKQLEIKAKNPIIWDFSSSPISNETYKQELIGVLREHEINFLIIDSFRRFHVGDENSSEAVARTFQFISEIKSLDISVLIIHHLKKEPPIGKVSLDQMFRGSSDLIAYPDNILAVKRMIEDDQWILKIDQVAIRAAEQMSPFTISIKGEDDKLEFSYKATLPSAIEKPSACINAIWGLIEEKNKVTTQEFISKFKTIFGENLIRKTLGRMVKDKLIALDKGAKGLHLYRKFTKEEQLILKKND